MTGPAAALWTELRHPALGPVWSVARRRLETTGLQPAGAVEIRLDDVAADLLGGLLGRRLRPGRRRVALADLDAVLRRSPAAASLVEVVTELGGPLRNRPAEKAAASRLRRDIDETWEALLAGSGLAGPWVGRWTAGLRADGLLAPPSAGALPVAVAAVARVLAEPVPRTLGELSALVAGDAHALDAGRRAGRIALRGLAAERGEPPPATGAERARLWAARGVRTDDVSGTVLVLGLRPPGTGRWAGMMRERADLGLPTHLTIRELTADDGPWAAPGTVVHACENPQIVQAAADRGVPGPLVCFLGNPSAAGSLLLDRLLSSGAEVRYHGDFDWPGLAIAGRVLLRGAVPWRLAAADYRAAVPAGTGVPLTGPEVATPWDPELRLALRDSGRAVHEEAVLDALLADLATRQ